VRRNLRSLARIAAMLILLAVMNLAAHAVRIYGD
jgi:hypothetical protein